MIDAARLRLTESPVDVAHDLDHHRRVWENCIWVIGQEKLEGEVDLDVLRVAAWWHDVERGSETHELMQEALKKVGMDVNWIGRVLLVINQHPFGNGQDGVEARILYDADKLEYVSVERVERVIEAIETGEMKSEVLLGYKRDFQMRLPHVPDSLNFKSTRRRFEEEKGEFLVCLKEVGME